MHRGWKKIEVGDLNLYLSCSVLGPELQKLPSLEQQQASIVIGIPTAIARVEMYWKPGAILHTVQDTSVN
jgi:hypothetical protein